MSFVYILTNESMPGYVKIGMTEKSVTSRMLDLDTTGVPLPFQCYYAARVADHRKVEQALHVAFGGNRVRKSREFFMVDPFRVKAVLELLAEEDVTPREDMGAQIQFCECRHSNWSPINFKSRRRYYLHCKNGCNGGVSRCGDVGIEGSIARPSKLWIQVDRSGWH